MSLPRELKKYLKIFLQADRTKVVIGDSCFKKVREDFRYWRFFFVRVRHGLNIMSESLQCRFIVPSARVLAIRDILVRIGFAKMIFAFNVFYI